jgi:hypothetical protein
VKGEEYRRVELDRDISRMQLEEHELMDVDWVREQKKKILFQQDLNARMNLLKTSRLSVLSKNTNEHSQLKHMNT